MPPTKTVTHRAIKFETSEENRIVYKSLNCPKIVLVLSDISLENVHFSRRLSGSHDSISELQFASCAKKMQQQ